MSLLSIAPGSQDMVASLQRAGYKLNAGANGQTYATAPGAMGASAAIYPGLYGTGSATAGAPGGGFGIGPGEGEGAFISGAGAGGYMGLVSGVAMLGLGVAAANSSGSTAAALGGGAIGYSVGSYGGGLLAAGLGATGALAGAISTGVGALVAVIGMIAASAIINGTGPKNERPNTGKRMADFLARMDRDVAAVRQATTYLELAEAIRSAMHHAYGGPPGRGDGMIRAGFAVYVKGQQVILPGGSYAPTMSLAEFAVLLSTDAQSFQARLQFGMAVQQIDSAYEQAVKDQAQIIDQFGAVQFAYGETGPGISRTTIVPGAAISTVPVGTYALSADRTAGMQAGLSPELIDLLLKNIAKRNIQTDRIADFSRELQLNL